MYVDLIFAINVNVNIYLLEIFLIADCITTNRPRMRSKVRQPIPVTPQWQVSRYAQKGELIYAKTYMYVYECIQLDFKVHNHSFYKYI